MRIRKSDLEAAHNVEMELVSSLVKNPEGFRKLPRKRIVIPGENLIVPVDSFKSKPEKIGKFTVLSKKSR